jgi:hypothetical protein
MTNPLLAFFGHHKCATQWISIIVQDVCLLTGLRFKAISNVDRSESINLQKFVIQHKLDFLLYTNANFNCVSKLGNYSGFHVIRDPRDLIVSAYYSHLYSHPLQSWPQLAEHRKRLQSISKEAGLLLELEFCRCFIEDMYTWDYQQPGVLELRMEDLIKSPCEKMVQAFLYLGLAQPVSDWSRGQETYVTMLVAGLSKLPPRLRSRLPGLMKNACLPTTTLKRIIQGQQFFVMAGGREQGQENVYSHYRKGIAGDWVNHFGRKHIEYFKHHYNEGLLRLGYETEKDW